MKKYDVNGLSIKDILDIPLSKLVSLSRADLARVTSRLVSAGNKRLRRFEKSGISTPASAYIDRNGGKFSTKNKNIYELREEFQRIKGFLGSETSTVRGYRRWEDKVSTTLEKEAGIDYGSLTEEQKRVFWKAYTKLEETDQANVHGAKYSQSLNTIYTAVKGGLNDDNIDAFVKELDTKQYDESAIDFLSEENNPFNLVSENPETSENPFK